MSSVLFMTIQTDVESLVNDVLCGRLGLPDLQRPFVWRDNKIRDLFDSMLKGYPIGYIMQWQSPIDYDDKIRTIGDNEKQFPRPQSLVIDGQQRLTALVAAMYDIKVKDKDFNERRVRIAYNPLTREFAVWSKAFERDPEWFAQISDLFLAHKDPNVGIGTLREKYFHDVNESRAKKKREPLTTTERTCIENNLTALIGLLKYSLPTMQINHSADEESVADIFVRVNSGGQSLTENNFIQTLISVYDNETSDRINKFAHDSRIPAQGTPYNNILALEPAHLIRMIVGFGFRRARLRYAYMLLRGKDLDSGVVTEKTRQENLNIFKEALEKVIDLNNWHAFLNIVAEAGYVSSKLIASENAVVFSYVLYLIAKYDYKLNAVQLSTLIRKWFFVSAITVFYTGSTEAAVEKQFADLRNIPSAQAFIDYINSIIDTRFTNDYFFVTLPAALDASSAISPAWNGYVAAQIVLNAPVLFGNTPIERYFIPGTSGTKNSIEKHHIFPKNYLTSIGIHTDRERNQIANFAYIGYAKNIAISDSAPSEYIPHYRQTLDQQAFNNACKMHALPPNFENMEYSEFLQKRRILMAGIVREAYNRLCCTQ